MTQTQNPRTLRFHESRHLTAATDYAERREANFTKLGDKTYLGIFAEKHEAAYAELKRKLRLAGPIHWVELPPPATTV